MAIVLDQPINDKDIKNLIERFSKACKEVRFISMSKSEENTNINLEVNSVKFDELNSISHKIKSDYKNSKLSLRVIMI